MLVLLPSEYGAREHRAMLLRHHGLGDAGHVNVLRRQNGTVCRVRLVIRHSKLEHLLICNYWIRCVTGILLEHAPAVNTVRILMPLNATVVRVV